MKIKGLKIQNIGIIEDVDLPFDRPLLLFFGEVKNGKTTLLNCVRWCFGGSFPTDILRHGQDDGFIELELDDGLIRREFYRAKTGETKARDIIFLRNGRPVQSPVAEIKRLVNPFLQNQDYLRNMGEAERKQYFAETFAVDTSELDSEYFEKDREAVRLRSKIKDYGDIDLTPVPASNAAELRAKIAAVKQEHNGKVSEAAIRMRALRDEHAAALQRIGQQNVYANNRKSDRERTEQSLTVLRTEIVELKAKLARMEDREKLGTEWLASNPELAMIPAAPAPDVAGLEAVTMSLPDTAALEQQLEEAARNEERAKQFEENQKKADQKKADQQALAQHEARMREIRAAKVAKLKEVSDTCGIPGLEFDERGVFTFEGTQAGMLSTSQLMKLSSLLSALYPQDLGIELIDRAESLGKSIFGFIERAKGENKTILATIVGEEPAKIPEEVGVFVVAGGKVTEKSEPKPRKPKPVKPAPATLPAGASPGPDTEQTPPPAQSSEPTKRTPRQSNFI